MFGSAGISPIGYSDPQLAFLWLTLLKTEQKLQINVMLFYALPLGGSYRYRILRQKLSLDRGAHLGLEGGGLGRHAAAVSATATFVYRLCFSKWRPNSSLLLLLFRDSADRVVSENGQYEELIASSHEIAASTAQLVAASKVDGRRWFGFTHPVTFIPRF